MKKKFAAPAVGVISAGVLSAGLLGMPATAQATPYPGWWQPAPFSWDLNTWKGARQELRSDISTARRAFNVTVRTAYTTMRADIAQERADLREVLNDPKSTARQKEAAREKFRRQTKPERMVFQSRSRAAAVTYRAAKFGGWQQFRETING